MIEPEEHYFQINFQTGLLSSQTVTYALIPTREVEEMYSG